MWGNNTNSLKAAINRVAFIALCMVLTYAVFWGVGNPVSIGPFSLWLIVLMFFLITSLLPTICNLKSVFANPILWLLLLFGIWVFVAMIRGFVAGNEIGIIIRDISGLSYFALFPFLLVILNSEKRIHAAMRCMMYAAFALSILMYGLWILYLFLPLYFDVVRGFFEKIAFLNYTRVSDTIPRILFVSMPFQLCGCAFPVYFQIKSRKFVLGYAVVTGSCLSTLLLTFTRALYVSVAVAAAIIVLCYMLLSNVEEKRRFWRQIGIAVCSFFVLILIVSLIGKTNYLEYSILRATSSMRQETKSTEETTTELTVEQTEETTTELTVEQTEETTTELTVEQTEETTTEPATDPNEIIGNEAQHYLDATAYSDSVRYWIKHELMKSIHISPIVGNGMGLKWELKKDWPEYSYLDLWAKTGIVGVLLYFVPIIYMTGCVIVDFRRKNASMLSCTWLAVMFGLMCYSTFQPFLNNIQCIFVYCCTLCVGNVEHQTFMKLQNLNKSSE